MDLFLPYLFKLELAISTNNLSTPLFEHIINYFF